MNAIYSSSSVNLTPATTPTDILTLTGSSTKTIRILSIDLTINQTTQGNSQWFLTKRSTANTGGTSGTPTIVPFDSLSSAATAVFRQYTANPSALGTSLGSVSIQWINAGGTGTTGQIFRWDFTNSSFGSGIVLRGTSQLLVLNFAGAAKPAGLIITNSTWLWIEE